MMTGDCPQPPWAAASWGSAPIRANAKNKEKRAFFIKILLKGK
jgi:hypothetical protein